MGWLKDYRSVIGILSLIAGCIFVYIDRTDVGLMLISGSTGVAVGKIPKKGNGGGVTPAIIAVFALSLAFAGCTTPISTPALNKLEINVFDRHDAYVNADQTLTGLDKKTFLRDTEILRLKIAEATKEGD